MKVHGRYVDFGIFRKGMCGVKDKKVRHSRGRADMKGVEHRVLLSVAIFLFDMVEVYSFYFVQKGGWVRSTFDVTHEGVVVFVLGEVPRAAEVVDEVFLSPFFTRASGDARVEEE